MRARDVRRRRATEERQAEFHLLAEQGQDPRRARLAVGREPVERARPASTARAPSARAMRTSTPPTPPSSRTSQRWPTASTTSGSASRVAGTPSSCRPPWFETTPPRRRGRTRAGRPRRWVHLDHEREACARSATRGRATWRLVVDRAEPGARVERAVEVRREVRQRQSPGGRVNASRRSRSPPPANGTSMVRTSAVAPESSASATRSATNRGRSTSTAAASASPPEPRRRARRAQRGEGRLAEDGARGRRGARAVAPSPSAVHQPLVRGRGDEQRHRQVVAEHGRARGHGRDVHEHPRPQRDPPERVDVRAERVLVPGASGDVAEHAGIDPLLGEALVVGDVQRLHARRILSRPEPTVSQATSVDTRTVLIASDRVQFWHR